MSGDYSRYGFDPRKDFSAVMLEQGRPLTDRDWNDQAIGASRRLQAGSFDVFGGAVVPSPTPNGFALTFDSSNALWIGEGRIYVDGLLVENHGTGPLVWDPALSELKGSQPTPYMPTSSGFAAPYMPNPAPLPATGHTAIVYLDVWEREVTQFEDSSLVESALGVDTTTRRQTAWQVKFLDNQAANTTCATPATFPAPSGGRLTSGPATIPGQTNPCLIPPASGYTGLENQLYRVEIHTGGTLGGATFKWSRDNASVCARVLQMVDASHIVVDSVGRDDVLRFSDGDWIEVTDDWREFSGQAGEIHQIVIGGGVDDSTRIITLRTGITAGLFPTDSLGNLTASRHTRIRRWDQGGKVLDQNGNVLVDLGAAGSAGVITTPASSSVSVLLENGIVVSFSLDSSGDPFGVGDYWVFAARANDGTVEQLNAAPPRGPHHHYAKLGVITFPNTFSDCRVPWPPANAGDSCCCTACVTPTTHAKGTYTIQKAVDDVTATGGTVCLAPGAYDLAAPVTIKVSAKIRITGQRGATTITAIAGAFSIAAADVALCDFAVSGGARATGNSNALIAVAGGVLVCERLSLAITSDTQTGAAIRFGSPLVTAAIRDCKISAPSGIVYTPPVAAGTNAAGALTNANATTNVNATELSIAPLRLDIAHNQFSALLDAITFDSPDATAVDLWIADNTITSGTLYAIGLQFRNLAASSALVAGNFIETKGSGVVASVNGLRIVDNVIRFIGAPVVQEGVTIWSLYPPTSLLAVCEARGNIISGFPVGGVAIRSPVDRAIVSGNQIDHVGVGVALQYTLTSVTTPTLAVSVDGNLITDIDLIAGGTIDPKTAILVGVWVNQATSASVRGNIIRRVGVNTPTAQSRAGIVAAGGDRAEVSENEISDVGPAGEFVGPSIGVSILQPFSSVQIGENVVRRYSPAALPAKSDTSPWTPIFILGVIPQGSQTPAIMSAGDFAVMPQRFTPTNDFAKTNLTGLFNVNFTAAPNPPPTPLSNKVSVRGNQLEGFGSSPVVFAVGAFDLVFSDNDCQQGTPASQLSTSADVILAVNTAVVAQNHVIGGGTAMSILAGSKTGFSALGNLTHGQILFDGQPLAAPWGTLNVTGL
jgi:hypothetical protein